MPDLVCAKCEKARLTSSHIMTCHYENTRRHNAVCDTFHRTFAGIKTNWEKEPPTGLCSNAWDSVTYVLLLDGVSRYYDYTVVDPARLDACRKYNPYPFGNFNNLFEAEKRNKLQHYRDDLEALKARDP